MKPRNEKTTSAPHPERSSSRAGGRTRDATRARSANVEPVRSSIRRRSSSDPDARSWLSLHADTLALLVVIVASIVVYTNSFKGAFVYDDVKQIVGNELIQEGRYFSQALKSDVWAFKGDKGSNWSNYWRPAFILWLMVNFRLFGLESTVGWHAGNLLLHLLVVLLAFRWLRRLGFDTALTFAIVLPYAVHPVHVESVTWISGSPDMLLAAAILGSLICLLAHLQNPSPLRIGASCLLYAIALFCKEIGVLFPALIALTVYVVSGPSLARSARWRHVLKVVVPFLVITGGYVVVHMILLGRSQIETPWQTGPLNIALTAPSLLFFYIRQSFFPLWLGPSYPLRRVTMGNLGMGNFLLPLAADLLLLGLLWWSARKQPVRWIGVALFLLPLVPPMNINAFTPEQLVHDRYLYLPLLGLFMVVVPGIADALKAWIPESPIRRRLLVGGAAAVSIPLGIATLAYNPAWSTELRLWTRGIESDPGSASNLTEYARLMYENKRYPEARSAVDKALSIQPVMLGYLIRSDIAVAERRYADAEADLTQVLTGQPDNSGAYERLAVCYERQGRLAEAERVLRGARDKVPHKRCQFTDALAIVLYLQNKKDDALAEMESVRSQVPLEYGSAGRNLLFHLGSLYAERGRASEARSALSEYLSASSNAHDAETRQMRREAQATLAGLKD